MFTSILPMLSASPRPIAFPPVFLIPIYWKVQGKEPFCHHLLDFVISRHISTPAYEGTVSMGRLQLDFASPLSLLSSHPYKRMYNNHLSKLLQNRQKMHTPSL